MKGSRCFDGAGTSSYVDREEDKLLSREIISTLLLPEQIYILGQLGVTKLVTVVIGSIDDPLNIKLTG